jgi:hypothetical protein
MMGPFANVTKGFNYVKSTLKSAYNSYGMRGVAGVGLAAGQQAWKGSAGARGQMAQGFRQGMAGIAGMGSVNSRRGARMYGDVLRRQWKNSTGYQRAGMVGAYGGAAGGVGAAADFLNPWGLGWGD